MLPQPLLTSRSLTAVLLSLLGSVAARADILGPVLRVDVSDANGLSGFWEADPADGQWEGDTFSVGTTGPIDIVDINDNVTVIATLDVAQVTYAGDAQIHLDFALSAGAATTTARVASGMLTMPNIRNGVGSLSAGLCTADVLGDGGGLIGVAGSGNAYIAQYNGWAADETGTTFAEVIPAVAVGDCGGGGEGALIDGPVHDISVAWHFELSQWDVVTGTSTFLITPEPGTFALAIIAVAFARPRRTA